MNLLNEDNIVHIFLNKIGDIVIANLLFILCSIPLVTIGPSLTALYHCMLRTVKDNNNGTIKTFFRAFKENFVQSLIVWLLIAAAGFVLITNMLFLIGNNGAASQILLYGSCAILALLIIFTLYIFPVIAAFANTLRALSRNAFLLAFIHFPTTLAMAVISLLPMYMTYQDIELMPLYACCWFFFGFGLTAFINSCLLYRFFRKLLPEEE
ncbi:YesL family protein [Blautia sp. HCP3S3_G3]|uniref:YesL family protein n=1 Tax=Blautia sp. HCP3S3_G3 TaxID=3438913 RepID=UPI003F8ACDE9